MTASRMILLTLGMACLALPGHGGEHRVEVGIPVFLDQKLRVLPACRLTKEEDNFRRFMRPQFDLCLQRSAGIEPRTGAIGQQRPWG